MASVPPIPPHLTTVTPRLVGPDGGRLRDAFGHQWMLSRVAEALSAEEIARRGAALS